MTTTVLIFENIIIGCYTWAWVVALLIRCEVITVQNLKLLLPHLQNHPAAIGVAFLLLIYPIGSMMNTLCFWLARGIFARRQERLLVKDHPSGLEFSVLKLFVAQNGNERVYSSISSLLPFMRISRAASLNSFLLACVLSSFGRPLLPSTILSLGICAVALPACWYAYRLEIEKTIAAYAALKHRQILAVAPSGREK